MNKKLLFLFFGLTLSACSDSKITIDNEAAKRGEKLASSCMACHSMAGENHKIGPSLAGVYGRKATFWDNYQYSDALIASNLVWTEETLKPFLIDPQSLVPGTNMVNNNLDEASTLDIIEYLKTL